MQNLGTNNSKCIQCKYRRIVHAGFCSEGCARAFCVRAQAGVILKPVDRRRKGGRLR